MGNIRNLEQIVTEVEEKMAANHSPVNIERMTEFTRLWVLEHKWTPEWQKVLDRISRGELTWREIAQSRYELKAEPDVKAAFKSLEKVPELPRERVDEILELVDQKFAQHDGKKPQGARAEPVPPNISRHEVDHSENHNNPRQGRAVEPETSAEIGEDESFEDVNLVQPEDV